MHTYPGFFMLRSVIEIRKLAALFSWGTWATPDRKVFEDGK